MIKRSFLDAPSLTSLAQFVLRDFLFSLPESSLRPKHYPLCNSPATLEAALKLIEVVAETSLSQFDNIVQELSELLDKVLIVS
jgi:hypothetical protein